MNNYICLLFYDISTSDEDKKEYRKFHKKIISNGFYNIQLSVYAKKYSIKETAHHYLEELKKHEFETSNIKAMVIPHNIFDNIVTIKGENTWIELILNDKDYIIRTMIDACKMIINNNLLCYTEFPKSYKILIGLAVSRNFIVRIQNEKFINDDKKLEDVYKLVLNENKKEQFLINTDKKYAKIKSDYEFSEMFLKKIEKLLKSDKINYKKLLSYNSVENIKGVVMSIESGVSKYGEKFSKINIDGQVIYDFRCEDIINGQCINIFVKRRKVFKQLIKIRKEIDVFVINEIIDDYTNCILTKKMIADKYKIKDRVIEEILFDIKRNETIVYKNNDIIV